MRAVSLHAVLSPILLALAATSVGAKEVNPAKPAVAKQLESKQICIELAEDVGVRLLETEGMSGTGTAADDDPAVYGGDAGVALLFASLYRATKRKKWLVATTSFLDRALAAKSEDPGLYTGRSGVGQACIEAFWATGEKHFLRQARACAAPVDKYRATDLISGAAGTGVFLLNLHRATGEERYLKQARKAGDYLAASAVQNKGSAHWPIAPGRNPRVYLGFSHGAAGIGYFLLHLGRRTKHGVYTELAVEAARFVLRHEDREGEERAHWWRTVPKSSDDRRVQWCHGAPGIGFFFHDLHRYRKKKLYTDALARCLSTIRARGRSARASACQCHGVTGNAELFLEVYAVGGDARWLREARLSGSAILLSDAFGLTVRRGIGSATYDSSYMLGLAGIGHFFLRLADPVATPLPMMVKP